MNERPNPFLSVARLFLGCSIAVSCGGERDPQATSTEFAVPPEGQESAASGTAVALGGGRFALPGRSEDSGLIDTLDSHNVRRSFLEGDAQWGELLFSLDDLFFVHAARRACGTEYGWSVRDEGGSVRKCNFRMKMLLERVDAQRSLILAAEVSAIDGEVEYCPEYAECIAAARVGQVLSDTSSLVEAGAVFCIEMYLQALHQPKLFDHEFVARLIMDHERVRKSAEASASSSNSLDDNDFRMRYMKRMADRYLEYLRWHYQNLRKDAGG